MFCGMKHNFADASPPTRAGIKLKHLQCIRMTVNYSVLQGYTWRKSGGDGVMCQLCAIAVVVMCGGCTEKKKKADCALFSGCGAMISA